MRSKIVDPYNKIVARTTQLARLQVRSSSLSSSPYQLGAGVGDWVDWDSESVCDRFITHSISGAE